MQSVCDNTTIACDKSQFCCGMNQGQTCQRWRAQKPHIRLRMGPHLSGENSSFRNYKQMQLVHFINDQHKQHKFVAQK